MHFKQYLMHIEKKSSHIKQEIHGRKEERYVYQLKANLPTELAQKWPTIRSIIAVELPQNNKE